MSLSAAGLNVAANALAAVIDNAQLHSADPGAAGTTSPTTAAVMAVTFGSASNGDISLTGGPYHFTGGAANGAATWVSLWDGVPGSGGVFMGAYALTGDQTFNAAGEYDLDSGVIDFD
jgi:hypothetical protein